METRIGEDGVTAPHLIAASPEDKLAMIDRWLTGHPNDVMYLEVKHDDSISWRDRKKAPGWRPTFMRVGVAGEWAAAEYVGSGPRGVRATFTPEPPRRPCRTGTTASSPPTR